MSVYNQYVQKLQSGDVKSLARAITIVENEIDGFKDILSSLTINQSIPIVGITGPPGAGKSTLVSALIKSYSQQNKKVGVIAIDPTSPFHFGSLLGDRIRMAEHFLDPNIFIRSLATRGSLGGLSSKTIEISDLLRSFPFDLIIIETVGVGQSEVEIVGLADITVLVLVPEGGDDIQGIKSGVMEIADIFVINKSDRPGADVFSNNLNNIIHERSSSFKHVSVIKTVATNNEGIDKLIEEISNINLNPTNPNRVLLMGDKAYRLIQNERMRDIEKSEIIEDLKGKIAETNFNIYQFIQKYI